MDFHRGHGRRGNEAERIRHREATRATRGIFMNCLFCGQRHDRGKCPAWGWKCSLSGSKSFRRQVSKTESPKDVKTVETEQYGVGSLKDDSATQHSVNCVNSRQTEPGNITLGIGPHRVKFQCNTGSECNILPLSDYKLATGDTNLKKLT